MNKKSIFISGALNFASSDFLDNSHQMLKFAGEVRKLTPFLYVPINDLNLTLVAGALSHDDYYGVDLYWLEKCDALALVPNPNNENSNGVAGEIEFAEKHNIPVLKGLNEVFEFLNK